jgi:hypothetical protein|tara:strand:+ start:1671 stop:1925 length:255 start_codon:yes stop_codon:yes gene_type:complete
MNVCPLKKYKDILGIPRKGAHSLRLLDTAVVDYILTILLAILITYITTIPLVITTIISFILGIILHIIFGVETNTVKFLGIKCK